MSKSIVDQQPGYMKRVFANPTRWTLNGAARIPSAGKQDLNTTVLLKDKSTPGSTSVASYTYADRYGGNRSDKPFEHVLKKTNRLSAGRFLVPAGKFRSIGGRWTIPRAEVKKLLDQFEKAGKGTVARSRAEGNKWRYFILERDGKTALYRTTVPKKLLRDKRYNRGTKSYNKARDKIKGQNRSIQLVATVRGSPPRYKQIFEFTNQVVNTGRKEFGGFFRERLKQAISTRRNK
jgi:hypothetical protein